MDFWMPATVDELEAAILSGSVAEGSELEFKALQGDGKIPREKVGKAIAALSLDGGVLIVGVGDENGRLVLEPRPLQGIKEAVANVAVDAVRPPVRPSIRELRKADRTGYLVVHLTASPRAPHMYDGSYYGRSGPRNVKLDDRQVRARWALHLDRRDDMRRLLSAELLRDPLTAEDSVHARLHVVAQPISANPTMLLDAVPDRRLRTWVSGLANDRLMRQPRGYSPGIHETNDTFPRAHGAARTCAYLDSDRTLKREDLQRIPYNRLVDVEFREDGGVRWYNARASDDPGTGESMMVTIICGEVASAIEAARVVTRQAEFRGGWWFGVSVQGLQSITTYDPDNNWRAPSWRYSEPVYEEVTEADHHTLHEPGSPVLEGLVGRLIRATLDVDQPASQFDPFPTEAQS